MRTTRPVLAALLALLMLPAPAVAAAGAGLRWQACDDDATAQCTTLAVPVDPGYPAGASLSMAVARRPAARPGLRIGVLVVNPGGPGGSGVDLVLDAPKFFSAAVRARFDIVGFDPRGVARSNPIVCAQSLVDAAPDPYARSKQEYLGLIEYNRKLGADCRKRTGPVFRHADSRTVAADLERLRIALREPRISFYGASYGTLLGTEYAERHPGRVRAIVLDSVMDHSTGTDAFLIDSTASARNAFEQFVSWCARDKRCILRGRDVRRMWAALIARAAAGTLKDPYRPGVTLTLNTLLDVALTAFYDPQWYSLAYYIREATAGATAAGRAAPEIEVEYGWPAIFCEDWDLPLSGYDSYARRLASLRSAAPLMPFSPLALTSVTGCLGYPSRPANPQRVLRPARVPTLLVNARHDPATPYVWAARTAQQLGPNATLVTYNGWGHVAYGRSGCVNATVDNYLIGLVRPAAGAACPGVIPDQFGVG